MAFIDPAARRVAALCAALLISVAGCAPKGVEPLAKPVKIDGACGVQVDRYPRTTSMGSILTSVYETLPPAGEAPSLARYRAGLKTTGGAIAHYDRLRLLKPDLAKTLGEGDGYVVIREAIFTNELLPNGNRYIYVDLLDHGTYRWQALRAADTQNICNDGSRLS